MHYFKNLELKTPILELFGCNWVNFEKNFYFFVSVFYLIFDVGVIWDWMKQNNKFLMMETSYKTS